MGKNYLVAVAALIAFSSLSAQLSSIQPQIRKVITDKRADVGVSIVELDGHDSLTINGSKPYPLMSVFKFPIAIYVLKQVDDGNLRLDQPIRVSKTDVAPMTRSAIKKKYPDGDVDIILRDMLRYMVSESDNIACDVLLRLVGGPSVVDRYLKSIGQDGFNISLTEADMAKDFNDERINSASPLACTNLLTAFYNKKLLVAASSSLLQNMMTERTVALDRIKGKLPENAIVAHKSGTSSSENGLTIATNDIGIVQLPNGHHFAIAIFVAESYEDDVTNASTIANISKIVWDYFSAAR